MMISCNEYESGLEKFNNLKKPAVVFTSQQGDIIADPVFIVKDNTGKLIQFPSCNFTYELVRKYKVGDTIK
jgi:hypothetical protein